MAYYPIFVDMQGRRCLVVGGGSVAERKIEGLLQAGAAVTVISPGISEQIRSWVQSGKIRHQGRSYQPGDLAGFQLAFVATNESAVNAMVKREGEGRGVLVNVADDPIHCDFILPSVLRRGDLTVAVATGGSSPALSRAIREELEGYFTEDYAVLAEIVAEVRREFTDSSKAPSAEAWHKALDGDLRQLIREGDQEKAKAYLLKRLEAETCR